LEEGVDGTENGNDFVIDGSSAVAAWNALEAFVRVRDCDCVSDPEDGPKGVFDGGPDSVLDCSLDGDLDDPDTALDGGLGRAAVEGDVENSGCGRDSAVWQGSVDETMGASFEELPQSAEVLRNEVRCRRMRSPSGGECNARFCVSFERRTCRCIELDCENVPPHAQPKETHANGFSPVCLLLWRDI